MTDSPPTPPAELSESLVETLDAYSSAQLRDVAQYAGALADHRERDTQRDESDEALAQPADRPKDCPDEVPRKATITTKTINDNRYDYWQWREGDTIKSKYKGPVSPDE